MQNTLMKFDPATGEERPYPSHAAQWREWHGGTAWLFDPWTGRRRDARDVGSDVHGLLIVPAGTLGGDTGCGASKQNKHEAGNDAQRPTHDKTHVTTTSMLIFAGVIAEMVRAEEREACAVAAEAIERTGREWVKDSLWANIKRDTAAAIRARSLPANT